MSKKLALFTGLLFIAFLLLMPYHAFAEGLTNTTNPTDPLNGLINIDMGDGQAGLTDSVRIILTLAVLSLAPSIVIMFTVFPQITIILGMAKQALGITNGALDKVLIGLAIFVTIYTMSPVLKDVNQAAYKPYREGAITFEQGVKLAEKPLKTFMIKNTYDKDIKVMLGIKGEKKPKKADDVSFWAVVPAFGLSQITKGLTAGLMVYLVFVLLDFVVGAVLNFMGMMMLPPQVVSVPIKVLLFIYIGGFGKLIELFFKSVVT